MKVSAILAGVLLLVLYGASILPTLAVHWGVLSFDLENPLFAVGSILLFSLLGFALTISWIVLGFAVLLLIVGLLT